MRVVVEILTGSLFYVELDNNATVADLKRAIGEQQKLPSDRFIFVLDKNPKRLMNVGDGVSLLDCGVEQASHIYLFFHPLNDASHQHHRSDS